MCHYKMSLYRVLLWAGMSSCNILCCYKDEEASDCCLITMLCRGCAVLSIMLSSFCYILPSTVSSISSRVVLSTDKKQLMSLKFTTGQLELKKLSIMGGEIHSRTICIFQVLFQDMIFFPIP